jgi:hypothetical protein
MYRVFLFYNWREHYEFNVFACDKLHCCCTIRAVSLFAALHVLTEYSLNTWCSHFIIGASAMDLTSFLVTNAAAAAVPYVLLLYLLSCMS